MDEIIRQDHFLKRNIIYIFVAVAVLISITIFLSKKSTAHMTNVFERPKPYDQIIRITAQGFLETDGLYSVSSKSSGDIINVSIEEGDTVEKGQTLIEMESVDLDFKIIEAQNNLWETESQIKDVRLEQLSRKIDLEVEKKRLLSKLEHSKYELSSTEYLYSEGVVSKINLHDKRLKVELETQEIKHISDQIERLPKLYQPKTKMLELKRISQVSRVDFYKKNLELLQVASPMDGLVTKVSAARGEQVSKGVVLAEISPIEPNKAVVKFPQRYMSKIIVGANIDIKYLNKLEAGVISRLRPLVENGFLEVEVKFESPLRGAITDMDISAYYNVEDDISGYSFTTPSYMGALDKVDTIYIKVNGEVEEYTLKNYKIYSDFVVSDDPILKRVEVMM